MMYSARPACWLLCLLFVIGCVFPAEASEVRDVLVLYDEGPLGNLSEAVFSVRTALTGMSRTARFELINSCEDASGYHHIIVLPGEDETLSVNAAQLLSDVSADVFWIGGDIRTMIPSAENVSGPVTLAYKDVSGALYEELLSSQTLPVLTTWNEWSGGTMSVYQADYPLCARSGQITYLAYYNASLTGMQAFLSDMLAEFFWPYQDARPIYSKYLVISDVYPFVDLEKLMNLVTLMQEEGTPYALMVMPIYSNAFYPSMQRYCEVLRYAQSLGASIVMRVPIVRAEEDETGQMAKYIAMAFESYVQYGVYPLALAAPQDYLHTDIGYNLLSVSRTLLTLPRETDATFETMHLDTTPLATQHQIVTASDATIITNAFATAQYISFSTSADELRDLLRALKTSVVPLSSLRTLQHSLYIGVHGLLYSPETGLYMDGAYDDLKYTPFDYEDPDFNRGFTQYLTEQVELSNRGILLFVIGSCVIFFIMIIMLRRQVQRRLLRKPRNHGGNPK